MFEKFAVSDWIQAANVFVVSITLMVLARQLTVQNRVAKAQLLRDRFEMYWRTYEPVNAGQIADFHINPDDYMTLEEYNSHYKGNDAAARRYIILAKLYEYLAFLFALRQLKIHDPLGNSWLERWVTDLTSQKEFVAINNYWRPYYPKFARLVDKLGRKHRRDR